MNVERWWKNGVLVRELRDGEEFTGNLGQRRATPAIPSLTNKATSLAGAAFRVSRAAISGEKVSTSSSEIERRLSICRACEFFKESPAMRCLKCGCFLNLKARLETEHCPINKW